MQERDKLSLDITWLRDESLEDTDNLPDPAILAAEIVEDLRAARISYFRRMARPRLKAMIEMCGVDRVLFGTDFGPVPMSPKLHIDLIDDTITDAGDRTKIFSTNTLALLRLAESAPRLVPQAA